MNQELFESLLFEEETTVLDFKSGQYKFVKASDEEKSEILKDILGFSNAWRRSTAYILVGVKEVIGGQSEVVGIEKSQHLDDHSLQQFVNARTNAPINFHYSAFEYKGKQVGIFEIVEQNRPIFLKSDYGKLKKNEVYVRRGSSTDPTKPALPDEIARMGESSLPVEAEILLSFEDKKQEITLNTQWLELPEYSILPDYSDGKNELFRTYLNQCNHNYYRNYSEFLGFHSIYEKMKLRIQNTGSSPAKNIRIEVTAQRESCVIVDIDDAPEKPKTTISALDHKIKGIKSAFIQEPGDIEISKNEKEYLIEINVGDLQPGRSISTDYFYIGTRYSSSETLSCTIFSDSLSKPNHSELYLIFNVEDIEASIADIKDRADKGVDDFKY